MGGGNCPTKTDTIRDEEIRVFVNCFFAMKKKQAEEGRICFGSRTWSTRWGRQGSRLMRSPGALHLQLESKAEYHEHRITKHVLLCV